MTLQLARTRQSNRDNVEDGLHAFVEEAFRHKMPSLIPFVHANKTVLEVAKQLKRQEGSPKTLYQYAFGISRFCRWLSRTPDEIVAECKGPDGEPLPKMLVKHTSVLDDFVGVLQDEGLAPGTVNNHAKGVKRLYRFNGLHLELPYRLSKRVRFKDRSPLPEELQKLIDLADARGKVIVSLLSLSGFRTGTLTQLKYRHVKKDLEKGVVPLHVQIESELNKGHYADYDSFIGQEGVDYLKLYLETRRRGGVERFSAARAGWREPPETITDESPLIRDGHAKTVRPISPQRIHDIVHSLYKKAGLLAGRTGSRYELRAHSLRKYFRTQLASLGVNTDYVDYMMGHVVDTYHDIQMKGPEFLRGIYAASGLAIRPKTQLSKMEMLKQVARAWGLDPERILTKEALASPHRSYASTFEREEIHAGTLTEALKEAVKKDILRSM